MTNPNGATAREPVIEVSFTVTVAMTGQQAGEYAAEYHLDIRDAPVVPRVARDITSRVQDTAHAALDDEYWIRSFTTVTVSAPRLRAGVKL